MKKLLCVILAIMMIGSLAAVNVFAYTVPVDGSNLIFSEDFDMGEHQFTTGNAGTLVDGCDPADGYALASKATGAVVDLSSRYTVEFDVMLPTAGDWHLYLNDKGCEAAPKEGIRIQGASVTAETWYTLRFVVDTSLFTGTTDINGQRAILVYQKLKGESEWKKSHHQYGTNEITTDEEGILQFRTHTAYANSNIGDNAIGFSNNVVVDNVKVFNMLYDLEYGTICKTLDSVSMPTFSGTNNLTQINYTTNATELSEENPEGYVVASFDAVNTVKGMPLAVHVGGGVIPGDTNVGTLSILCSDDILNKTYSYKVVCRGVYNKKDMYVTVYRKLADSDEEYVLIENDKEYVWNNGGRISSGNNNVRFGYRTSDVKLAYGYSNEEGAVNDFSSTVWAVTNVQVVDGAAAVRGFIAKANNTLDANLAFVTNAPNAAVVIAVYEEGRLVDVDFENVAVGEGMIDLAVDYDAETQDAVLFIWEESDGEPIIEALNL